MRPRATARALACAVALAAAGGPAPPARAQEDPAEPPAAGSEESAEPSREELAALDEGELRNYWRGRLRDARLRARVARQRLEAAEDAYRRARHRERTRGAAKAALEEELAQARAELEAAEAELAELPERARRSGALPGWLRALEEPEAAGTP